MPRQMLARSRAPARLALAALAAAAALLVPAPARAESPPDAQWRVGTAVGFESGSVGGEDFGAAKVRVDAERSLGTLGPKTSLGLVVSLGAFHPSGSYSVTIPVGYYWEPASVDWDANVFEAVVAARVRYQLSPRMSLFGDGGVGVNHVASRATLPPELAALGGTSLVADGTGGVVRLAGGAVWTLSPDVELGLELLGLQVRFGDGAETGFGMLLSVSHRL